MAIERLLCFIPLPAFCQSAVVSTDGTRLLYQYIDNAVSISVPGYSCNEIDIRSTTCRVKGSNCHYIINPDSLKPAVLSIFLKKQQRIIDSIAIPVKQLPNPFTMVSTGTNIGQLLTEGPSVASEDHTDLSRFFHIASFSVTMIRGDKVLYEHNYTSCVYDTALLAAIENAMPGDKIFWENIKVEGPDKILRLLNPVFYTKLGNGIYWKKEH